MNKRGLQIETRLDAWAMARYRLIQARDRVFKTEVELVAARQELRECTAEDAAARAVASAPVLFAMPGAAETAQKISASPG